MEIYSPQEDSHLLEKHVKQLCKEKSILDMGTGSGIQALTALKAGASKVTASDINEKALMNLSKTKDFRLSVKKSNLFKNITGKFDIIAFNPPYLPIDPDEPESSRFSTTGGERGDEIILSFLKAAPKHLKKDGFILLILSSLTPMGEIDNSLKILGLKSKLLDQKKIFMESLFLYRIEKQ